MVDRSNSIINRGTGRNWMLNFISKKLLKRNNHTGKISRSSSRMQRTISIHHLECTDYVPQSEVGQMATEIESSKIALNFDSSVISEHELTVRKEIRESVNRMLDEACSGIDAVDDFSGSHYNLDEMQNKFLDEGALKRKLLETRVTLSRKENTNPMAMENEFAIQSKLLDRLELFIASRETLLDNTEGPDYISPDLVESPTEIRMLRKSASCPEFLVNSADILFPCHKSMRSASFVNQGTQFETSSFINTEGVSSCSEGVPGSHELRKQREAGTILNQLRDFKQRMKDVIIIKNRKDKHRILRDGILHRVPFGHKLPDDVEDKKLNLRNDPSSEICDGGGEGSKFSNAAHDFYRKWAHKSFQRSYLFAESLDKYSQLFGNLLLDEKKKVPERSKSVREDSGLPRFPKNLGRMLSSPALRSYSFNKDVWSDVYHETAETLTPKRHGKERKRLVRSESIHEDTDLQEENLSKNFRRMLSSPLLRSYSFNKVLQSADLELTKTVTPEPLGNCMENPMLEKNDCEHEVVVEPDILSSVEDTNSDKFITPTVDSFIEMVESRVNPVSVEGYTRIKSSFITEVMEEEPDFDCMPAAGREAECDIKSGRPSFSSILDISLLEGSASSAKDLLTKESELQPIHTVSDSQSSMDCIKQNYVEHSNPAYNPKQMGSDATSFIIHIDSKDESVFEFIRHILAELRYRILHQKTEFSSYELGDEFHGAPFDRQLLYDLIKEVLLEIYDNSPTPNLCLQRFRSKISSMPEGGYLLKDVWAKISWHLHSPLGFDATIDDLMAHIFAKNDGWLNLYCDAERVALQLERLILDDLLEESTVLSNRFVF